jgi:hypothetical protein
VSSKLLAEWFWTDRWMGSSAFLLPLEPRGLYREMLTQAWRGGARLPLDHEAIRRAIGATAEEWARAWPFVSTYWREADGVLVPCDDLGGSLPLPGQTGHRPHIPLATRRAVFDRDGRACGFCGRGDALELDHVIPFSRGGPDTVANLRVLCKPCNMGRGAPCG